MSGHTFSLPPVDGTLNIPVFASPTGTPILLPIERAELSEVTISADGNCIGDINPDWFANGGPNCQDQSLSTCPKWLTNGSLAGFITGAAANEVPLPIGGTLCGLLCGSAGIGHSCTPAEETSCGDYCSATRTPGGCKDSFWLAATFAANAVKINATGPAPCDPR